MKVELNDYAPNSYYEIKDDLHDVTYDLFLFHKAYLIFLQLNH